LPGAEMPMRLRCQFEVFSKSLHMSLELRPVSF
jgi:hypothetical protein